MHKNQLAAFVLLSTLPFGSCGCSASSAATPLPAGVCAEDGSASFGSGTVEASCDPNGVVWQGSGGGCSARVLTLYSCEEGGSGYTRVGVSRHGGAWGGACQYDDDTYTCGDYIVEEVAAPCADVEAGVVFDSPVGFVQCGRELQYVAQCSQACPNDNTPVTLGGRYAWSVCESGVLCNEDGTP
jgi:hypothetical protein